MEMWAKYRRGWERMKEGSGKLQKEGTFGSGRMTRNFSCRTSQNSMCKARRHKAEWYDQGRDSTWWKHVVSGRRHSLGES